MSYVTENRKIKDADKAPPAPPERPGRRASDDYEQMFALSRSTASRPDSVRALDESYVFTRLLQGRVPPELADALRMRCPDAFKVAQAYEAPVAQSKRAGLIEAFIRAWHARHKLPDVDFSNGQRLQREAV